MITLNGNEIKYSIRTGGEVHIQTEETFGRCTVCLENSNDIMALLLLSSMVSISELTIYYLPYARQDRKFKSEPLSLKVMANLINSMNIPLVFLVNPHSDVASALINNSVVITQKECASNLVTLLKNCVLVAPDAGAYKKLDYTDRELAFASKSRDNNGNPKIVSIVGEVQDKDCLILDDICDGGRTFIELAKKLKEAGANKLYLYTTYGIYSNGLEGLLEYYTEIYYTKKINCTLEHERLIEA